jgi:MFS superfamily sulfate permease-like transporter
VVAASRRSRPDWRSPPGWRPSAGLLRLGFLASFISEPVLKGFIVGLALTIIIGQVPKLFGIKKGSGDFFEQLRHVTTRLGDTHGLTLLVGALSLAVIIALRRFAPAVPGSLVAVPLGIAAVRLFGLDHHGVEIVGPIKSGLPSFGLPDVRASDVGALAAGGIGVMLVGFAEGLGAAKTYAAREHQQIDPNRELLGLGGANLASAVSSGMVVNGSLSETAVNTSAGARSQFSGLIVAALTIITLLALTGVFEDLAEATLSAIVIAAVIELVDVPALVSLYRAYSCRLGREFGLVARPDFIAAIAALLGVTVFDTLPGLFIGITASLLLLIYRASRPYVATLGKTPGGDGPLPRHRPPPRRPRPRPHRRAPCRERPVLCERRRHPRPDPQSRSRGRNPRGRPRRPDDPLHRCHRLAHARRTDRRAGPPERRAADRPRHRPGPRPGWRRPLTLLTLDSKTGSPLLVQFIHATPQRVIALRGRSRGRLTTIV